jgi:hypothetical protein
MVWVKKNGRNTRIGEGANPIYPKYGLKGWDKPLPLSVCPRQEKEMPVRNSNLHITQLFRVCRRELGCAVSSGINPAAVWLIQ